MNQPRILVDLLILVAASLPVALALRRAGQSTILGYLLTGLIIGPGGLKLIDAEGIHELADLGVGLLLFTIGIELPLARLATLRRIAIGGGALQVGLTVGLGALAIGGVTGRWDEAVYLGCALALSSSAIVLKTLADRGDLDAPYTAPTTAVSIFQDLATVPMMVVLPGLGAGHGFGEVVLPTLGALARAAALLLVLWLGSRHVIDRLLFQVARARSPEIFILTVVALLLAAALGSAAAGLSLALGAFVGGILLAESDYASQILAEVSPFKGVFQAIFFASIGMLLEPSYVLAHPLRVAGVAAAVVAGKAALATLALLAVRAPARTAVAVGILLAQVGEFSFVIVALGRAKGILDDETYQLALAASFASMAVAPPLIANVRRIVAALAWLPGLGRSLTAGADAALGERAGRLSGHVVIGGFGPVGRDVAMFLLDNGAEFVVIDLNPKTVRDFAKQHLPIFFGDFANPTVLEEAGIERAAAFAVTAPDVEAVRHAVRVARELNPTIRIVARTKYRGLADAILRAGANEVVEEEFETALEMVARIAKTLSIDRKAVAERMASQRLERYGRE